MLANDRVAKNLMVSDWRRVNPERLGGVRGAYLPGIRVDGVRTLGKRRGSRVNMMN